MTMEFMLLLPRTNIMEIHYLLGVFTKEAGLLAGLATVLIARTWLDIWYVLCADLCLFILKKWKRKMGIDFQVSIYVSNWYMTILL